MLVFARRGLVPDAWTAASLSTERCALLLEGDWSEAELTVSPNAERLLSLDTLIDATRFAELDEAAERLASDIARAAAPVDLGDALPQPNFAEINALRLRYEAIRWLRVVAFWQTRGKASGGELVELYVAPGRDNEYVVLWQALSRAFRFTLRIHFVLGDVAQSAPFKLPKNAWWRRTLARLFANRAASRDRRSPAASAHRPQLLFVGNPRILDQVCDAVLDRGANVAWLYDRFAVGAWYARRADGIAWITCDDDSPAADRFPMSLLRSPVTFGDVDLSEVAEAWFRRWRRRLGAAQSRQWDRIGEHLASSRPRHIVLDEDATPLPRIVIAHAARLGIPTMVVQHGVCCVRFGFAPLAADVFCAWDDAARRQLEAWDVPKERIVVTGPPRAPSQVRRADPSHTKRIVLLATLPPRDDRPDALALHLTTRTHAAMLDAACAAIDELRRETSGDVELIVKMHPRAPHDPQLAQTLRLFPMLQHRFVVSGSLAEVLASADCVLSCVSSAGIEAATAGLPVVQLLPQGSGAILPAEWYGLLGSARTLEELRPLLHKSLSRTTIDACESNAGPIANGAARIAEVLLAPHELCCVDASHLHSLAGPHTARSQTALRAEEASHG
jgi:hypothetical protein